jgi:hypothetical protein
VLCVVFVSTRPAVLQVIAARLRTLALRLPRSLFCWRREASAREREWATCVRPFSIRIACQSPFASCQTDTGEERGPAQPLHFHFDTRVPQPLRPHRLASRHPQQCFHRIYSLLQRRAGSDMRTAGISRVCPGARGRDQYRRASSSPARGAFACKYSRERGHVRRSTATLLCKLSPQLPPPAKRTCVLPTGTG